MCGLFVSCLWVVLFGLMGGALWFRWICLVWLLVWFGFDLIWFVRFVLFCYYTLVLSRWLLIDWMWGGIARFCFGLISIVVCLFWWAVSLVRLEFCWIYLFRFFVGVWFVWWVVDSCTWWFCGLIYLLLVCWLLCCFNFVIYVLWFVFVLGLIVVFGVIFVVG